MHQLTRTLLRAALLCAFILHASRAHWEYRGGPERQGRSDEVLKSPLTLQWAVEFENERLSSGAEATVSNNVVVVTTQSGREFGLDPASGQKIFERPGQYPHRLVLPGIPLVRQQAAFSEGRMYVTAEDLRLRCIETNSGKILWTSPQMYGQTARDYAPVVVKSGARKYIVVRTNPVLNMAQQISSDRDFLLKQAGVPTGDWKKTDAWIKSPEAAGTPELFAKEQKAIAEYLAGNPRAETFYVFDAQTGLRAFTSPILWVGGCQGVGTPPVITKDGKALVLYRSAYGNWNHGVAPLVSLGLLSFESGKIEPLRHNQGPQPPWNTFWGTADEAQNFTLASDDLIIVHQGTLSRFNLQTRNLEKIWGERDTFGGFKNPSWARNEWHGPARGGVAISGGHVYWTTGSRVLCLGPGEPKQKASIKTIKPSMPLASLPAPDFRIEETAREIINTNWAPLYVEPGLAGREFFFDSTREQMMALSWAYPQLGAEMQSRMKEHLLGLWTTNRFQSSRLDQGARRELFPIPPDVLKLGRGEAAHPFGDTYSIWFFAERCQVWPQILDRWDDLEKQFHDFRTQHPRFGSKPELYFNRYLASLIALADIADNAAQPKTAFEARELSARAAETLEYWWKNAVQAGELTTFNGSKELDPFLGKGSGLSFAVFPHRHKIALFQDMTPEVAAIVAGRAPHAAKEIWNRFSNLYATWHLQGEERQVHFGENFVDTPDLALGAFQTMAFLSGTPREEWLRRVDIPFCLADLYYLQKASIAAAK